MANLLQKKAAATKRICVFGPPKAGKTQMVSQLATKYKMIWIDIENGWNTLLKLPQAAQANVELIAIPDSKQFPVAVETLLKIFTGAKLNVCEEHGKVNCPLCKKDSKPMTEVCFSELGADTIVVIDSLTQFTTSAIANITKDKPDDYKMQFDDWGNLRAIVEKLLSMIQAAKYNVVCITHEEEVEMEDGRKKIVPVCGSSKSSRNTAKYFDEVIYCEVKNKKHVAGSSTGYSNNILTGSRTDTVLDNREGASILEIFESSTTSTPSQGEKAVAKLAGLIAGK